MADNSMTFSNTLMQLGGEDFLRELTEFMLNRIMEADVTQRINAEPHERSDERETYRNGYRDRQYNTRLGTLDLRIPKLREGTYFPPFLEARRLSEKALNAVIQEAWINGVSTRKCQRRVKSGSSATWVEPFTPEGSLLVVAVTRSWPGHTSAVLAFSGDLHALRLHRYSICW